MTESTLRSDLAEAIDTIEAGYEFLLAYAAQGRHTDRGAASGQNPRDKLESMADAMARLPALANAIADARSPDGASLFGAFLDAFERDAAVSIAAVRIVLGAEDISSQIIDNLNASIHLRALLTDIFLIDEAFKG